MLIYSAWTHPPILRQTLHAYSLRPGIFFLNMSKLRETVLSSSSSEGVFCSPKTKHDRRTVSRPGLLVSARIFRDVENNSENMLYPFFAPWNLICLISIANTNLRRLSEHETEIFLGLGIHFVDVSFMRFTSAHFLFRQLPRRFSLRNVT